MDKSYHSSPFRIAWRSRWVCYLETIYIAYIVLQVSL